MWIDGNGRNKLESERRDFSRTGSDVSVSAKGRHGVDEEVDLYVGSGVLFVRGVGRSGEVRRRIADPQWRCPP